jgi:hypothetical protein
LCPFGPIAPLHFVYLCSTHSKLPAFRWWSELSHASDRGLGQFTSLWPCSWQHSPSPTRGSGAVVVQDTVPSQKRTPSRPAL